MSSLASDESLLALELELEDEDEDVAADDAALVTVAPLRVRGGGCSLRELRVRFLRAGAPAGGVPSFCDAAAAFARASARSCMCLSKTSMTVK